MPRRARAVLVAGFSAALVLLLVAANRAYDLLGRFPSGALIADAIRFDRYARETAER
jgi:hypothetical protein